MAKTATPATQKLSYAKISTLFQTLNKVIAYSAFDLSTLQSIALKKELLKKLEIYDEARKQILEQTGKINKELNKYEFPNPEEEAKAVELVSQLNNKEEDITIWELKVKLIPEHKDKVTGLDLELLYDIYWDKLLIE